MTARLADVAKHAGVSIATASLVISGNDKGRTSPSTREVVLASAAELGYIGNAAASSLRTRRTNTIGFLSDTIASTPYAVRMVEAANRAAFDAGHLLLLSNTGGEHEVEAAAVAEFRRHSVSQTIYASMFHRLVEVPAQLGPGAVILDGYCDDPTRPSIVPDEEQGARDAVNHIIAAGHRRIAMINDEETERVAATLRFKAYREALAAASIPFDPALVEVAPTVSRGADHATARLLDRAHPTAIFCFNDERAAGVYREAHRRGLRIPEDLSVVGFDNLELIAEQLEPPLTTVQLPHAEMGKWAVEHVLGKAPDTGSYPVRQHCPLVIRSSVGPPRAA